MVAKAQTKLERELDLRCFVKSQNTFRMALSVLFTKQQHSKIDELSRPRIRGGSSGSDSSSDSNEDNLNRSDVETRI